MFVVRGGPEFEIIATNAMGEPLMATPALAGGHMYVRGSGICLRLENANNPG